MIIKMVNFEIGSVLQCGVVRVGHCIYLWSICFRNTGNNYIIILIIIIIRDKEESG